MQDLIDKTHSQHFELYRRKRLEDMGFNDGDGETKQVSLQETYELRRQDYMKDIQGREEQMRQSFVNKVKEKEAELKQAEQEVRVEYIHQPDKTANICRRYHWFSRQMTSEKRAQKFHTDDVSLPRSRYSAFDWLKKILHAARPIRSTSQVWVVTRHQNGISALVSQT